MSENFYYKSPIGVLEISTYENKITKLTLANFYKKSEKNKFHKNIENQLNEYFRGERKKFNLNIEVKGTDFQELVWKELLKIPYGETQSYEEIANVIEHKNAQRAVGSACNKNL